MSTDTLLDIAREAAKKAYSPYSVFGVGAALKCKNGKIYTGCNIENSSFSATVCAERTAFYKALSEGEREFENCRRRRKGREFRKGVYPLRHLPSGYGGILRKGFCHYYHKK